MFIHLASIGRKVSSAKGLWAWLAHYTLFGNLRYNLGLLGDLQLLCDRNAYALNQE